MDVWEEFYVTFIKEGILQVWQFVIPILIPAIVFTFKKVYRKFEIANMQRKKMEYSNKPSITLAVIGKTGNGKSSSANTILGHQGFKATDNTASCTQIASFCCAVRDGIKIKIVDTPGVIDTNKDQELDNIAKHIPGIMGLCPEGIHALLLVLKYGNRFTKEDANAVEKIKRIFGENVLSDHGIIIMTYGENFEMNNNDESFKNWCDTQTDEIKMLFQECQNRVVLFYNSQKKEFAKKKLDALKNIFTIVNDVRAKGTYTNEKFDKCFMEREKLVLEHRLPELKIEYQIKIDELILSLINARSSKKMTKIDLQNIKEKCDDLLKDIELKSNKTNLYDDFKKKVSDIKNYLDDIDLTKPVQEQLTPVMSMLEILKNPPISLVVAGTIISSLAIVAGGVVLTATACATAPAIGVAVGAAVTTTSATGLGASLLKYFKKKKKKQL